MVHAVSKGMALVSDLTISISLIPQEQTQSAFPLASCLFQIFPLSATREYTKPRKQLKHECIDKLISAHFNVPYVHNDKKKASKEVYFCFINQKIRLIRQHSYVVKLPSTNLTPFLLT